MRTSVKLIRHALEIEALELIPGGRILKSGRRSPYFFNSGRFVTGESMKLLGSILAEAIKLHWNQLGSPTVIFGPAYKGITLAALATANLGRSEHQELRQVLFAHDRKEEKAHGEGGLIVGADLTGQRVLIVDDVITTGSTKDTCVERIKAHGGTVTGLMVLFDRQERGEASELSAAAEFSQKYALPTFAVATRDDLIEYIKAHSANSNAMRSMLDEIKTYRAQYGAQG
jgi:orotate phosphoribosyltransferase